MTDGGFYGRRFLDGAGLGFTGNADSGTDADLWRVVRSGQNAPLKYARAARRGHGGRLGYRVDRGHQ